MSDRREHVKRLPHVGGNGAGTYPVCTTCNCYWDVAHEDLADLQKYCDELEKGNRAANDELRRLIVQIDRVLRGPGVQP